MTREEYRNKLEWLLVDVTRNSLEARRYASVDLAEYVVRLLEQMREDCALEADKCHEGPDAAECIRVLPLPQPEP